MKRTTAFLLLVAMLLQLASCTAVPSADSNSETAESAELLPEKETRVRHKLPDNLDFGGSDFMGGFFEVTEYFANDPAYYFVDEMTGDNMNDAVYRRQKRVENELNVKLDCAIELSAEEYEALYKAGDDVYQLLFLHHISNVANFVTSGYLYNADTMPYMDMSADWYNQEQIDALRMGKNTYYILSDLNITNPGAILFNKKIIEDNNFPNPYTLVYNGTWTIDALVQMALDVRNDVNGDGEYTSDDDIYGINIWEVTNCAPFLPGCNLLISERDAETGKHVFILNNEKTYSALDKLYRLYETSGSVNFEVVDFDYGTTLFQLHYAAGLEQAADITEFDVGIVPFPKYDEKQKEYYCLDISGLMAIAGTIKNPEMVGAVIELLAWESGNEVVDTYYNKLLKTRYAADEETRDMLNIIFDSVTYDVCGNYFGFQEGFCGMVYLAALTIVEGMNYYTAYFRKEKSFTKRTLEEFYAALDIVEGTAAAEQEQ